MESGQPSGRGYPGRHAALSWCLFDWANSPLPTVIITFVFSAYFARGVVGDEVAGTVLWSQALTIAGLTVAVLAPILGAIADQTGPKKPWLAGFSAIGILAAGALWFVHPDPADTMLALIAVGLVLIGTEFANIFYNAMLARVAAPEPGRRLGLGARLSRRHRLPADRPSGVRSGRDTALRAGQGRGGACPGNRPAGGCLVRDLFHSAA